MLLSWKSACLFFSCGALLWLARPRCPLLHLCPSLSSLSPPRSISGNRSPLCIQGLSARGRGMSSSSCSSGSSSRRRRRDGVIEREIYYWWCLLIAVESCSGLREDALLDNVCSCNLLRRAAVLWRDIMWAADCLERMTFLCTSCEPSSKPPSLPFPQPQHPPTPQQYFKTVYIYL